MSHPRWRRPLDQLGRDTVRRLLVEDAVGGVPTPLDWAGDAYLYLGRGDARAAEREYVSVREEIGSLGGVMPSAPGS